MVSVIIYLNLIALSLLLLTPLIGLNEAFRLFFLSSRLSYTVS